MVYTNVDKVRALTGLTQSQIRDLDLQEMINQAIAIVNLHTIVRVREELVQYIDKVRENDYSDGTTTTFYVKYGINNYLADMNNDGSVTTSDVRVFKVDNTDTRTELTVSSIDIEDGSFTLSAAPGTDTRNLYVWYGYSFYNGNTPDKLIELLTGYLSASFAYLHKDHSLPSSTKFGNITVSRSQVGMAYNRYTDRFNELLKQVIVPCNKPRVRQYSQLI